jgi:hypothetical protein
VRRALGSLLKAGLIERWRWRRYPDYPPEMDHSR